MRNLFIIKNNNSLQRYNSSNNFKRNKNDVISKEFPNHNVNNNKINNPFNGYGIHFPDKKNSKLESNINSEWY